MARVSGTTNPTNLREIARKDVGLSRSEVAGKKQVLVTKFELGKYKFAGTEQVFLIARAGNTSQRYEMGTVEMWKEGPFQLNNLDASQVLRFRILIRTAASAKLIATVENLRCAGDGDIESLLPIEVADLGQRLWSVLIDEDSGPVLKCNERVFPSGGSAEGYAPFRALVLPEALGQVLAYIAMDPGRVLVEGTIWAEWATWMRNLGIEMPPPLDEEQRADWIKDSTGTFCDLYTFADDLQNFLQPSEAI